MSLVAFVDDRTFWASVGRATETPTHAKSLSDAFDNMFRFRCRPAKCAIAAPPGVNVHHIAFSFGYKSVDRLDILGVSHSLADIGHTCLLKYEIAAIQDLAISISFLPVDFHRRRILLKQLVLPKLLWGPGAVVSNHEVLANARSAILAGFNGYGLVDTPNCILVAIL